MLITPTNSNELLNRPTNRRDQRNQLLGHIARGSTGATVAPETPHQLAQGKFTPTQIVNVVNSSRVCDYADNPIIKCNLSPVVNYYC